MKRPASSVIETRKRPASSLTQTSDASQLPPLEELPATFQAMRPALNLLDVKISHSFKHGGKWHSIPVDDLRRYYDRRRKSMQGEMKLLRWVESQADPVGGLTKGVAYFCWIVLPGKPDRLPKVSVDGLRSAVRNGGFDEIYLIRWVPLDNVPAGVKLIDGNNFVHQGQINQWLEQGFHVAHIADYVRCLACTARTDDQAAWFVDLDVVHVHSGWPCNWSYMGFVFGTFSMNPGGRANSNPVQRKIKEMLDYCRRPADQLKLASPFRLPKDNPLLPPLVESLREYFASGEPVNKEHEYDVPFMNKMKDAIISWGLEKAFAPSEAYSVMPYWAWEKPTNKGTRLNEKWGINVIQSGQVISVNSFWQSSKFESLANHQDDHDFVHSTSAWQALLDYALPAAVDVVEYLDWPTDPETDDIPAHMIPPSMSLWKHSLFCGNFGLMELLDSGTSGTVYKARDRHNGELVAVKIHLPQKGVRTVAFTDEPLWLLRSQSDHVVKMLDSFVSATVVAIAMELLPFTLWSGLLQNQSTLDDDGCLTLGNSMFQALSHLLGQSIVHLDIHPRNVLLPDGMDMAKAKLGDFGMADRRKPPPEKSMLEWNVYPWAYRAPELALAKGLKWSETCKPRAEPGFLVNLQCFHLDVWAMGIVCLQSRFSNAQVNASYSSCYGDRLASFFRLTLGMAGKLSHENGWFIPTRLSWEVKPQYTFDEDWQTRFPWLAKALQLSPQDREGADAVLHSINECIAWRSAFLPESSQTE